MKAVRSQKQKTIFIDLDDTLIDTFDLLITPLEWAAARAICQIEGCPFQAEQLAEILLELRKRSPADLEDKVRDLLKADANRALAERERIFSDFSVDDITISPKVIATLKLLMQDYLLVLVTEGQPKIQKRKVRRLGIGNLFEDILVVDRAGDISKEAAIANFIASRKRFPKQSIIVGNRLDRDIIAGNRLGIPTIWLRAGEGSEMERDCVQATPDVVIDDISELPAAIQALAGP
ncbi:MAG: HAD family hydrolase [Methylocella sp.]